MLDHIQSHNRLAYIHALKDAAQKNRLQKNAKYRISSRVQKIIEYGKQRSTRINALDVQKQREIPVEKTEAVRRERILQGSRAGQPETTCLNPVDICRAINGAHADDSKTKEKASISKV